MTRLVVISPEGEDAREIPALEHLCAAGLARYHLRKPQWSLQRTSAFLRALDPGVCRRIVLHQHHVLAKEFPVGGLHEKEGSLLPETYRSNRPREFFHSRACHTAERLKMAAADVDAVLFSPVFPSISKPAHGPSAEIANVSQWLPGRSTKSKGAAVFALGGIDEATIPRAFDLGFDGVAVLGSVWQRTDPVAAFQSLLKTVTRTWTEAAVA